MITTPAPVGFLDPIPGIIPFGSLSIFGGAPGVGKTTMIKDWIRRWQAGQTICEQYTNCPNKFYFLAADRQQEELTLELPQVEIYSIVDDDLFDLRQLSNAATAIDVFASCVNRLDPQPGGMLFIDPVAPLFVPGFINDPRAVARIFMTISRINRQRNITSLCTAHFHKQPADATQLYRRPQDRIAGSTAFSGHTDTQMYLIDPEEPQQPYHVFGWTARKRKPQTWKFTRVPEGFVPYRSLEEVGTPSSAVSESGAALFQLIPNRGIKTGDLEQAALVACGISRATFYRLLSELLALGAVARKKHGWIIRQSLQGGESPPT